MSSTSGKASTTSGYTIALSEQTSTTGTLSGQANTVSDQTSFPSTASDKMGSAIIITLD